MRKVDANDYADYEDDRAARIRDHAERVAREYTIARRERQPFPIPNAVFVAQWQAAETLDEACKTLGLPVLKCSHRAAVLRRRGVQLKTFKRRVPVSDEAFISAWEDSQSRSEVAKRLGLTISQCAHIATRLRRHGVELKRLYAAAIQPGPRRREAS